MEMESIWKKATAVFFVASIILGGALYFKYNPIEEDTIKIGQLEIQPQQLADLTEPLEEGPYIICSMKDDECYVSQKVMLP